MVGFEKEAGIGEHLEHVELGGAKAAAPDLIFAGWWARFVFVDNGENKKTVTYLLNASTVIEAEESLASLYAFLNALSSAVIAKATIEKRYRPASFASPGSHSQIEAFASLKGYDSVSAAKVHTLDVPSPEASIFLTLSGDGANVVNPENSIVFTFMNLFRPGQKAMFEGPEFIKFNGFKSGLRKTGKSKRG